MHAPGIKVKEFYWYIFEQTGLTKHTVAGYRIWEACLACLRINVNSLAAVSSKLLACLTMHIYACKFSGHTFTHNGLPPVFSRYYFRSHCKIDLLLEFRIKINQQFKYITALQSSSTYRWGCGSLKSINLWVATTAKRKHRHTIESTVTRSSFLLHVYCFYDVISFIAVIIFSYNSMKYGNWNANWMVVTMMAAIH